MPQVSVKGKLVEHAETVFRRRGFNGASVQDITSAAGVPKGSFYNHFKSKQELAAEIVRRYSGATDFSMLTTDTHTAGTASERLRAHFAAQANRTRATGTEYGCLLVTMASDTPTAGDEVRSAVRDSIDDWTTILHTVIEQGQRAGEITSDRPARDLAAFLIDAFEGGALRGKATGDPTASMKSLDIALGALLP
ncbi:MULTISPECIES: TetR/AcrR family transcriptional regulator [Streptomyces]|uniref:TetR/AcrR family transcriptional repressor of nem operon n=2 Tax=Streptomyces TaxID=1883 RepID=A0ABT9L9G1_STRGD|nr:MULTISPECIES: TetR/AcrR family transcriptional regulator [Streptomyces]MDP9680335.1 TetR/AcrR family transcriptional repressor of nem operon [Streptomyces griseoviridis]GGT09325.1 transcriptional regulator [Streptomyces griseoviridis]GGU52809.1 transcriptional regulator [Streptomyces daghestanicus]GHI29147.1 transcriptional regulator [Streptomyces daghestanicus]